jgi:hypothetical protein
MKATQEEEAQLKVLIIAHLEYCNVLDTPTVCSMNTPDNQALLVNLVLKYVCTKMCSVGEAIVAVERDYNANIIAD